MKNLKVSYKLGLDFGAVLVLTIIVALMGTRSIEGLIERGEKSLAAGARMDDVNEIQRASVRFRETSDTPRCQGSCRCAMKAEHLEDACHAVSVMRAGPSDSPIRR